MMRPVLAIGAMLLATGAGAETPPARPDNAYCASLAKALDRVGSGGPAFLRSYEPGPGEDDLPGPIRQSAFSYDNALAAIALVACGDVARASRIADAFVWVAGHDRTQDAVRIRNAYQAGAVDGSPAKLPGWWDNASSRWFEDAYQDGTATGNVAWVALALLNVHQAAPDGRYLQAVQGLLGWVDKVPGRAGAPGGYAGGVSGFDPAQEDLRWESTEHNVDVAAAAHWAHRLAGDPKLEGMADRAGAFVAARFQQDLGRFAIGTKADGADAEPRQVALDTQLWPILGVPRPPADWGRAVQYAYRRLRAGDGMTFAGIGANQWTEGTCQAALALHAVGDDDASRALLAAAGRSVAPSGLLYATSAGEVPTGLNVESSGGVEFKYYHRPHVGATAWAAIATAHWNPFTGERVR